MGRSWRGGVTGMGGHRKKFLRNRVRRRPQARFLSARRSCDDPVSNDPRRRDLSRLCAGFPKWWLGLDRFDGPAVATPPAGHVVDHLRQSLFVLHRRSPPTL